MRKLNTHSKTSLFLMEMLLSLLILAIAGTACIRIFAAARISRQQAREWNHIQELTANVGEFLEGWDKNPDTFLLLFPDGQQQEHSFDFYYDTHWESCTSEEGCYKMNVILSCEDRKKTAVLHFTSVSGQTLYETEISFPDFMSDREDAQ